MDPSDVKGTILHPSQFHPRGLVQGLFNICYNWVAYSNCCYLGESLAKELRQRLKVDQLRLFRLRAPSAFHDTIRNLLGRVPLVGRS